MLSLLLCASFLAPQAPQRFSGGDAAFAERVFHDVDEAGDLWARGVRWKMRFSRAGATFLPLFGPGQERHHPLELSPASARLGTLELLFDGTAAAVRDGDRVVFDRGPLLEVYDLAPQAVEQSFVFPVVPRGGDLVLTLDTLTDLDACESTQGLRFGHSLGSLLYSPAFALDGLGRRLALETRLCGSAVEIRVPAWFLELAEEPLVVDPVLSMTVLEASDAYADLNPDVSFDATTGRWLVVWERQVTALESDVPYRLLNDAGSTISSGYLNLDLQHWTRPVVANLNAKNVFYAAASVQDLVGSWSVKGRALSASAAPGSTGGTVAQLSQPTVPHAGPWLSPRPVVGGDPSTDPSHGTFLVVWWEDLSAAAQPSIRFRRVDAKGVPLGSESTPLPSLVSYDSYPAISASNDGLEWTVAHRRWDGLLALARIAWNGQVTQAPTPLPEFVSSLVKVSSTVDGKVLVASASYGDKINLLLVQGTQVLDQAFFPIFSYGLIDFELAVDGQRFVLGYQDYSRSVLATLFEPIAGQIAILEHVAAPGNYYPVVGEAGLATRQESGGVAGRALQILSAEYTYPYDPDIWRAFYQPQ